LTEESKLNRLALNTNGTRLAAAFDDARVLVVDTKSCQSLFNYTVDKNAIIPTPSILALEFSLPSNELLIVSNKEIAVVDLSTNKIAWRSAGMWLSGTFNTSGKSVYAQKLNDTYVTEIVQLDASNGEQKKLFDLPRGVVGNGIAATHLNQLFSLHQKIDDPFKRGTVIQYDLSNRVQKSSIDTGAPVEAFILCEDGTRLLTRENSAKTFPLGSRLSGKVRVFDVETAEEVYAISFDEQITGMTMDQKNTRILFSSDRGVIDEMQIEPVLQRKIIFQNSVTEHFIDASPRWDEFYTFGTNCYHARSLTDGSLLRTWEFPGDLIEGSLPQLIPTKNKTYIVLDRGSEGGIAIIDFADSTVLATISHEVDAISDQTRFEFSVNDGCTMVMRSSDYGVEIWSVENKTKSVYRGAEGEFVRGVFFVGSDAYAWCSSGIMSGLDTVYTLRKLPGGEVSDERFFDKYLIPEYVSPDGSQSLALEGKYLMLVDRDYLKKPAGQLRLMRLREIAAKSDLQVVVEE